MAIPIDPVAIKTLPVSERLSPKTKILLKDPAEAPTGTMLTATTKATVIMVFRRLPFMASRQNAKPTNPRDAARLIGILLPELYEFHNKKNAPIFT